jgi:hypothetical protein
VAPSEPRGLRRPPRWGGATAAGELDADLVDAPVVGSEEFRLWSEELGHRLAADGPAPIEPQLARLAALALELELEPRSARVLADRTRPEIVRSRAFFEVAIALDEPGPWAA